MSNLSIILDVNVKLTDGTLVNVEIQRHGNDDFKKRAVYYSSQRLIDQGTKGMNYNELSSTVSLNIVDFNVFKSKEYYSRCYFIKEGSQELLTDLISIDFLELKKVNWNNSSKGDSIVLWALFMNSEYKEELEMIKDIDKTFEESVDEMISLSSHPGILSQADLEERKRRDEYSINEHARKQGMKQGLEKGIEKGIEKGMKQGIESGAKNNEKEIILNMLNNSFSDEMIISITGISKDNLEEFKSTI